MRRHVSIDRHKAAKISNSHLHNNQPADLTQEEPSGISEEPGPRTLVYRAEARAKRATGIVDSV